MAHSHDLYPYLYPYLYETDKDIYEPSNHDKGIFMSKVHDKDTLSLESGIQSEDQTTRQKAGSWRTIKEGSRLRNGCAESRHRSQIAKE
jgi:hypothetical protein